MQLILKVAKEIKTPIEIGGGIRNLETIKKYIEGGSKNSNFRNSCHRR